MAEVSYQIDGIDFRNYGVYVSDSDGIVNKPKLKAVATTSWDSYHGEDIDFGQFYYAPREISLSCFIKAESKGEFLDRLFRFERIFDKPSLLRLLILVGEKPLPYNVYCRDEISITKAWSENQMVGIFKLKLIEPQPVKRVLKHIRVSEATKTCSINISTHKLVNIFWGDGYVDQDISGSNVTISHSYKENGEYFPVITGCIDEIEAFQTNASIVWNKL